jgi:hypothetical protein
MSFHYSGGDAYDHRAMQTSIFMDGPSAARPPNPNTKVGAFSPRPDNRPWMQAAQQAGIQAMQQAAMVAQPESPPPVAAGRKALERRHSQIVAPPALGGDAMMPPPMALPEPLFLTLLPPPVISSVVSAGAAEAPPSPLVQKRVLPERPSPLVRKPRPRREMPVNDVDAAGTSTSTDDDDAHHDSGNEHDGVFGFDDDVDVDAAACAAAAIFQARSVPAGGNPEPPSPIEPPSWVEPSLPSKRSHEPPSPLVRKARRDTAELDEADHSPDLPEMRTAPRPAHVLKVGGGPSSPFSAHGMGGVKSSAGGGPLKRAAATDLSPLSAQFTCLRRLGGEKEAARSTLERVQELPAGRGGQGQSRPRPAGVRTGRFYST